MCSSDLENENLDVWKYHQAWLECFYNRERDQFVAGAIGKKRYAKIVFQKQEVVNGILNSKNMYSIELFGLTPQRNIALRGSWSDSLNWPKYPVKYNLDAGIITELDSGGKFYI